MTMRRSVEDLLVKVDDKLEGIRAEDTENVINYIELNPKARKGFAEYLIEDYQSGIEKDTHYKKLLGRYAYIPLTVGLASTAVINTVQNSFSFFDMGGVLYLTCMSGLIASHFMINKRNEYFYGVLDAELSKVNLKEKLFDFYRKFPN